MLTQHLIFILLFMLMSPAIADTYGPVKTGEMIWGITGKLNLTPEVSRYQIIIALLRANPHAFSVPCNFNSLKIGTTLTIPPLIEISQLSANDALREFSRQELEWKTHRQGQGIQCVTPTLPPVKMTDAPTVSSTAPPSAPSEKVIILPAPPKIAETHPFEQQIAIFSKFIQQIDYQKIYTLAINQPLGLSVGILISSCVFLILLIFRMFGRWFWKSSSYPIVVSKENSTHRSPLIATTNAVIEERLSTLRLCLARAEMDKVENLLQEISEKGTPVQQFEGRQLGEIYKTMTNLQEDFQRTQKLLITQSPPPSAEVSQPPIIESTQQGEYLPQCYLPENKEKVFELVDTIMQVLDKELQAQGQLVGAYQNRHTPPVLETEEYQIVNKTSIEQSNPQVDGTARQTQPTRYL